MQTIRQIADSGFIKSFARLASGTVLAQLLMVLSSPLITRLYSKEAFGLYATYAALVVILGVIAALRYEIAIPLASSQSELRVLLKLCFLAATLVGLVCLFLFSTFSEPILALANLASARLLLIVSVFGIFVSGVLSILNFLCISKNELTVVSRSRIVHAVVHITVQLTASTFGAVALAFGQLSGKIAAALSLLPTARKLAGHTIESEAEPTLSQVAVKYKRFPLYSSWAGLFNALGEQLPFVMLAVLFSPGAAGLFALTHRVLSLPITVVSSLVGDIFYANARRSIDNGTLTSSFADTYRVLSFLITMPCLVIIIIGPDFFAFVFGEPWRESGVFAQFMALLIYSNFVASPLSSIMSAFSKDHEFLIFNIGLITLRIAAIVYGASVDNLTLSIALFCSVSAVCYLGLLLRVIFMSGNTLVTFFQNTLVPLAVNTLLVVPLLYVNQRHQVDAQWWFVFVITGVLGALYLFITARAHFTRVLVSQSQE